MIKLIIFDLDGVLVDEKYYRKSNKLSNIDKICYQPRGTYF